MKRLIIALLFASTLSAGALQKTTRELTLIITSEQDAAAAVHGVTVEKVIEDRLADLEHSAEGVLKQQIEANLTKLPPESKDTLVSLRKQQDADYKAAVDVEVAKLPVIAVVP